MRSERFTWFLLAVLMGSSLISLVVWENNTSGIVTRAAGEEMHIDVLMDFDGPLGMEADVSVSILSMYLNGTLRTTDELRSLFEISPNETLEEIENSLWERTVNLTDSSFTDYRFDVLDGNLSIDSMDPSLSADDPIQYSMDLEGETDIQSYLDESRSEMLEEGREDFFIASLFLSGFTYSRSPDLVAYEGETVTYRIPDSMDPIGDGEISLDVNSPDFTPSEGYHRITVDGLFKIAKTRFDFQISYSDAVLPVEEDIRGELLIDWKELNRVGVNGDIRMRSVESGRSAALTSVPPSMGVPMYIPASLIRYSHMENILNDEDLSGIADQIADEFETDLRDTFDDDSIEGVVEIDLGNDVDLPMSGSDLLAVIDSEDPLDAEVGTGNDIMLDILKGYLKDDVIGLMNGGLRIYHDLQPVNDDRFDIEIMAPPNITIWGDPHIRVDGNGQRNVYDYSPGRKLIGSSLAPDDLSTTISVKGTVDLSEVRSMYVLDTELDIEADIDIGLHSMEFDKDDTDLTTDLDYELDHLTSDMIRLLMDMEIIDRNDIEGTVEEDFRKGIGDLLPDDDSFNVDIIHETLDFDGNIYEMNGDDPIVLSIEASGTLSLDNINQDDDGDDEDTVTANGIIPFHFDPLLPVRRMERTMDLEEVKNWDLDVEISIPSGIGLKAWTGLENDDHVKDLEVSKEGGHPTLHLDLRPGEADRITIQVEVGGYLLANNIGACFGCCMLGIVIVLVMLLLIFVRIARKKKKSGRSSKTEDTSDEKKDTDQEDDGETMSWDDD